MKPKRIETHTKECPLPSAITIYLENTEIIDYLKVDDRGYIRPNKRAWIGLKVTVLIGKYDVSIGILGASIYVPAGTPKFLCEVLSNSYLSSIGKEYANRDVTLIVHKKT